MSHSLPEKSAVADLRDVEQFGSAEVTRPSFGPQVFDDYLSPCEERIRYMGEFHSF
jgi:hypothetical protein